MPHVARPARAPRPLPPLAALAFVALASVPAAAAPCAGFSDVDAGSGACADVEWIRNRGVTLGCTGTTYCPNAPVSRLQMAAFMSRLGSVLQPAFLHATQYVSNVPNNGGTILCQVQAPVAGYARVASTSSAVIQYSAGADSTMFAQLVVSTDQGTTWSPWSGLLVTLTLPLGALGTVAPAAPPIAVPANQSMRFGLQPSGSSGSFFEDVNCEITVRIESRPDGPLS